MSSKDPIRPRPTLYFKFRSLSTPLKKTEFAIKSTITAKVILILWIIFFVQFISINIAQISVFQQVRLSEGINIWWVIVAMFFHGSIIHIIVNSATLFYFGLILENDHKNLNYLAVLVGLGIISLFFQYISLAISIKTGVLSFAGQPNTLFMGTSGAICGIVAISCLKRPCAEIYPIFIPVARVNIISGVLIFSVLSLLCLLVFGVFSFGLAHTSHITGIIFGLLYGVERYGVRRAKHIFYDFFR